MLIYSPLTEIFTEEIEILERSIKTSQVKGISLTKVVQFSSVPQSTQTHVHLVGTAIQPAHPLLPPSPPAFNLSQHQGIFK